MFDLYDIAREVSEVDRTAGELPAVRRRNVDGVVGNAYSSRRFSGSPAAYTTGYMARLTLALDKLCPPPPEYHLKLYEIDGSSPAPRPRS
jgi:hypothetical protein